VRGESERREWVRERERGRAGRGDGGMERGREGETENKVEVE